MEDVSLNENYMIRPRIDALLNKDTKCKITFLSADIGWGNSTSSSVLCSVSIFSRVNITEKSNEAQVLS